jgi:hypothetical protein
MCDISHSATCSMPPYGSHAFSALTLQLTFVINAHAVIYPQKIHALVSDQTAERRRMSHRQHLTEALRHSRVNAVVCITGALQPCGLMHSALGEVAVPTGIEEISIRALPALSVRTIFRRRTRSTECLPRADPERFQCTHLDPGVRRLPVECRQR